MQIRPLFLSFHWVLFSARQNSNSLAEHGRRRIVALSPAWPSRRTLLFVFSMFSLIASVTRCWFDWRHNQPQNLRVLYPPNLLSAYQIVNGRLLLELCFMLPHYWTTIQRIAGSHGRGRNNMENHNLPCKDFHLEFTSITSFHEVWLQTSHTTIYSISRSEEVNPCHGALRRNLGYIRKAWMKNILRPWFINLECSSSPYV